MSTFAEEIKAIRAGEILLDAPYQLALKPRDSLRMVLLIPYEHEYSLMCMGPLALYDTINRDSTIPAVAERAILYSCLRRQGNRLVLPGNETYRTIESETRVADADIVGVSITNSADLPSFFRMLDLAGIPRRMHPLAAALAASQFDRLDEIISARTDRLNYLSRCLAEVHGVTPPITRDHVTRGAFYGYKPFFADTECPGVPKRLYIEALRAEGVSVEMPGSTHSTDPHCIRA